MQFRGAARHSRIDQFQTRNIKKTRLAVQDYLAQRTAGRGRMHYAVARKTIGKIQPVNFTSAQNGVMIGRILIQTRPAFFEHRFAVKRNVARCFARS